MAAAAIIMMIQGPDLALGIRQLQVHSVDYCIWLDVYGMLSSIFWVCSASHIVHVVWFTDANGNCGCCSGFVAQRIRVVTNSSLLSEVTGCFVDQGGSGWSG